MYYDKNLPNIIKSWPNLIKNFVEYKIRYWQNFKMLLKCDKVAKFHQSGHTLGTLSACNISMVLEHVKFETALIRNRKSLFQVSVVRIQP